MLTGNVSEIDVETGQGSIRQENGMMIQFQRSEIPFKVGDKVAFDVAEQDSGFVAVDVRPTDKRFHF